MREGDVRVRNGRIDAIGGALSAAQGVEAGGRLLFPGLIDDQVHFREPGLTHKADIASESRAAAAGGITSFMDMPNVSPPTLTMDLIRQKQAIAEKSSRINYAFYIGASANNIADIAEADAAVIAGVKIFMGSSTGDMLVDDDKTLRAIFSAAPTLIAVHCESTPRIKQRQAAFAQKGEIPAAAHPQIRDEQACYESSSRAVALAKECGARLHVLHITTALELDLFAPGPPQGKQITAEACVHHLLFDESGYQTLGMRMKANPAVKSRADRDALRAAAVDGRIDVFATDHAPHLPEEKDLPYEQAAAGMPLAEYALPAFLELVSDGALTYPQIAAKTAGAAADIFGISDRGRIREGCWADLVLVDEVSGGMPARDQALSKCGWTPFAGYSFRHAVHSTYVNGALAWHDGIVDDSIHGMPLQFARRSARTD